MTLTLDPSLIEGDPVRYLRRVFDKFRVYLRRKYGAPVKYIAVLEFHKSGIPHLHLLVDQFIHWEWIRAAWSARYIYYRCSPGRGGCALPYMREQDVAIRLGEVLKGICVPEGVADHIVGSLRSGLDRFGTRTSEKPRRASPASGRGSDTDGSNLRRQARRQDQ